MAIVIHFRDGNTTLLKRAFRVDEAQPGTPGSQSPLTFICYDKKGQVIGRFDIREVRGYYITDGDSQTADA
jgi:hypothetical protein